MWRRVSVLLTGLLFLLVPLGLAGTVSGDVGLSLNIPGQDPLRNVAGEPVLVAGVWHELRMRLDTSAQETVEVRAVLEGSSTQDMSTAYRWLRDEVNDSWTDPLYDTFIRPDLSASDGTDLTFVLGVDAAATPGPWWLEVRRDDALVAALGMEVRAAEVSFGLSAADFVFRSEPFTPALLRSEDAGQYLRIRNGGNVPLRLAVSFDLLADRFALTNPAQVVTAGADGRYYLELSLGSRPPQILAVQGTSRVEVAHRIPSPGATQLLPAVEGAFDVTVVVGRSGYAVEAVSNVVFQSPQGLQAAYDSLLVWQVFLTGGQDVSLDVRAEGARLEAVTHEGRLLDLPARLSPTPDGELPLTVRLRTTLPATAAVIEYTLSLLETGEVRTFRTTVAVGAAPPPDPTPSYLWLVAAALTVGILGLVSYNQWRHEALRTRAPSGEREPRRGGPPAGGSRTQGGRGHGKRADRKSVV